MKFRTRPDNHQPYPRRFGNQEVIMSLCKLRERGPAIDVFL